MYKSDKILVVTWLFVSIFLGKSLFAQTYEELIANSSYGVDISERLPSLAILQQQAIENSPIFKMLDSDVEIYNYKIQEEQRLWLHSMGFEGGARYGLFDNLILTQDLGLVESATNTTRQGRYYVGAYVKIPLSDLFENSNVKTARAERDRIQFQREVRIQELRQLIIVRYNNVIREYRGLVIKSNAVENFRMQRLRAQQDFRNGIMTVYEFARLEDMLSSAVIDLENAKMDFKTAFQVLEETVGVKITLIE